MGTPEQHRGMVEAYDIAKIPKVISPEAFDQRFADPLFEDTIVGCTSVSLTHILAGIGETFSLLAYSHLNHPLLPSPMHIYMNTASHVLPEVFDENDDQAMLLSKVIRSNRGYGKAWSQTEVLRERLPFSAFFVQYLSIETGIFDAFAGIVFPESFAEAMKNTKRDDEKQGVLVLSELLGGEEAFNDAIRAMRMRGGVQIVYGNREAFQDFVANQAVAPRIEIATYEIEIELFSGIPAHLIEAVIPLGPYEQGILLPERKQVLTDSQNSVINDVL